MAHAPHKYLHAFVAEATEQLEQLASELVRIEQEVPGGALWDSIFRRVHSVKGSAATIGLSGVVAIAHAAETLIGKLKAQQAKPERTHVDLLLQATDELVQEVQHASGTAHAPRADEGAPLALAARLAEASRVLPDLPAPLPAPRIVGQKPVADPGTPRLDVAFSLSKACQAPGARSLIVQRKLKGLGVLLEMDPQPAALMQKKGGVRVTALLATTRPPDEVRAAFDGIPEVEEVEVSAAPVANAPEPAPQAAEEAGAIRAVPDTAATEETRTDATVRVRAQALDQLLDQAAEVLHGIARLREAVRTLPENAATQFEAEIDRLRRTARDLHGRVMNARLTPFSSLTERLPRAIRDLAHRLGKEVELEVQGGAVELDRTVIEALADPLTHLVRNAVDHGLETSAQRISMGKSVRGLLVLSARRERDKVLVEVSDDGAGFDGERLRQRAIDMGVLSPDKLPDVTEQQSYELAFLPGLSTRDEATELSGRGVGLDAVKAAVERLGGKIGLRSAPGKGSRFTLELPLSVSMANLLLVQVGGELYGLPMTRIVATTEYDLSARGGEGFEARSLAVMGQLVRAYSLAKLFGLPSLAPPGPRPFAVLEVDGITFALSVDRLVGQEEAVLKPLFPPIDRIKGLAGTTVLGNGRPLLVLDPRGLHELAEASQRLRGAA
ncbi:MAG: chemotaxis protein CheA [Deltaproteobacteria bacterium]|nr:MAG: chemotaxis protein CheA [Deltaproteobacteria bacterium]